MDLTRVKPLPQVELLPMNQSRFYRTVWTDAAEVGKGFQRESSEFRPSAIAFMPCDIGIPVTSQRQSFRCASWRVWSARWTGRSSLSVASTSSVWFFSVTVELVAQAGTPVTTSMLSSTRWGCARLIRSIYGVDRTNQNIWAFLLGLCPPECTSAHAASAGDKVHSLFGS